MLSFLLTLGLAVSSFSPSGPDSVAPLVERSLIDFSESGSVESWRSVDDVVMGGFSGSRFERLDAQTARFRGIVSLDNNGGFASARSTITGFSSRDVDGFSMKVLGDGKTYKLALRGDRSWDGVSWQASFATVAGEWTSVHLPLHAFSPRWRGRLVLDTESFDPRTLQSVGLSISDKQEGAFELQLRDLSTWHDPAGQDRLERLARIVSSGTHDSRIRAMLRDSNRVMVLATPSSLDAEASLLSGDLWAHDAAMRDRDLLLLELYGENAGRLAGSTLSEKQVAGLRKAWELPAATWQVALVGRDGGVKQRWDARFEVHEAFQLIDSMPMRRDELRRRGLGPAAGD